MDDYELSRREREADEALYAVDPDLAIELGYAPPPAPKLEVQIRMQQELSRMAGAQRQRSVEQNLGSLASQLEAAQHDQMLRSHMGGIMGALQGGPHGSAVGSALGGAIGGFLGGRHFPPRYR